jgi:hypothetical protein
MTSKNGTTPDDTTSDDLLADLSLPERTVEVVLAGGLIAEVEAIQKQIATVKRDVTTLGDQGIVTELERQRDVLLERMEATRLQVRLRALPGEQWLSLVIAHPPRQDNKHDTARGINVDTMFKAVVRECCVWVRRGERTQPGDTLPTEWWEKLFAGLNDSDFEALTDTAWSLNRRRVDVPFLPRGSAPPASSETR